mgnify:CR=1 FL=1
MGRPKANRGKESEETKEEEAKPTVEVEIEQVTDPKTGETVEEITVVETNVPAEESSEDLELVDGVPQFDRPENYVFKEEEIVYVIDPNGYDIWEGQISKIVGDAYAIHYPEYPEDDGELNGTERILPQTEKNKDIFRIMEHVRSTSEEKAPRKPRKTQKKKKVRGTRRNPLRRTTVSKKKYSDI